MYFKKLELLGFKSFAEKTVLHFEPGITAVVGPNGCGKSNIFDSIRWVLGEQSVKSLRGSKMEDVIFNGTENIPALGYAEVSLTFSNEAKILPIDYDEVTITRRLYRSGESEYLLNKTQVRLRDVLELLMGTGIGAESYSLIEQGKIDLILSSRPEDRRLVFDEAAGISKYKSQKKETIRKLEETEANLLRLSDIISEVKRQINSLERQAAKARRYKEVFDKLKKLETEMSAFQIRQHQERIDSLNTELNQFLAQEAEKIALDVELNKEFSQTQEELLKLEEKSGNLLNQANVLENIILGDTQQLSFNHERAGELRERRKVLEVKKTELLLKISEDEAKIGSLKVNIGNIENELADKKSLELKLAHNLEEITSSINSTQANIKEAKAKILEFVSAEAALNNQVRTFTGELNQVLVRKKRLDIEKLKTEEELSVVHSNLEIAAGAFTQIHKKFVDEKEECDKLKILYDDAIKENNVLTECLQNLEGEKLALDSQKEFLSSLKLRYENIAESFNATVLLETPAPKDISGIIVKVQNVEDAIEGDNDAKCRIRGIAKPISLDPEGLIKKIENLSCDMDKTKNELNLKAKVIEEFLSKLSSHQKVLHESEIEWNNCKNQKDNIAEHYKKLKEEFEFLRLDSQEADSQLEKLNEKERLLSEKLLTVKESYKNNQQAIERFLEELSLKNNEKEKTLIDITRIKAEISAVCDKLSSIKETFKLYENADSKDKETLASHLKDEAASSGRIQELEESFIKLQEKIDNAQKQKSASKEENETLMSLIAEKKNNFKCLQDKLQVCSHNINDTKTKIHECKMRLQELSFLRDGIYEKMSQVYKIDTSQLNASSVSDFKAEEVINEIGLLKEKIDAYGQVNLIAISEFEELKQRFEFLNSQQADLIKSKESLHQAILKINRTTKNMFLETFEKLAAEFKNYFRLLFGGGEAQLFLLDENDVLESGIEIICRPPGKKLQNVLLLSGGEKSLSAIALLFAIFKVKPSPFCVLDEIDAALDEANVDRFSRMLVDFTNQSQFIVITHNKKTIANANIMYGITMEKAGISKIVSVKLAENGKEEKNNDSSLSKPRSYAPSASPLGEQERGKEEKEILEPA